MLNKPALFIIAVKKNEKIILFWGFKIFVEK